MTFLDMINRELAKRMQLAVEDSSLPVARETFLILFAGLQ